uniref:Secreted protein n=1 Tax=Salix viminalis TaxID=40686 RepID=A0A6N2N099_SALVM
MDEHKTHSWMMLTLIRTEICWTLGTAILGCMTDQTYSNYQTKNSPASCERSISASHEPYKYIMEHNQKVEPRKFSSLENHSAIRAGCICTVCDHQHKIAIDDMREATKQK